MHGKQAKITKSMVCQEVFASLNHSFCVIQRERHTSKGNHARQQAMAQGFDHLHKGSGMVERVRYPWEAASRSWSQQGKQQVMEVLSDHDQDE